MSKPNITDTRPDFELNAVSSLPTLSQIAAEELAIAGGDRIEAALAMSQRLLGDEILREALIAPIVQRVCQQQISVVIRSRRERVWHQPPASTSRRRVKTAAAVNRLSLMRFPLPSGRLLGDATGAEVREAAAYYLTKGRDAMSKHRWLAAIGDAVPGSRVVRRVLDEMGLQALRKQAEAVAA